MDTARTSWIPQAEAAIRRLPDVISARIKATGDSVREIHVVTASQVSAKKIVRNIQTLLIAQFGIDFDHRVVSIAPFLPGDPLDAISNGADADADEPVRTSKVDPRDEMDEPESDPGLERIRFGSVNVFVSGRRAQAQVELRWKGVPRMGSASGWSTRDGALRLAAQATLAAVQEFLDEGTALGLEAVDVVRIGRHQVAVVGLELLAHRSQKSLVGCCTIEADAQQAVVLATLSALNRVVGGLPTKEPTEYVLRPTST